ncbi:hypothetical protein IHO40_03235 [Wolbachia endosymbiont of Mansonella ozzardi]|uniref:hypothetical protein n=1 Tax=Wolbachia endosymbiont of Mansonella ozzardi TaxID=137464 RepID=UPI001CE1B6CA|nr:hypothetical protein [Wolbachia endosymbiont of Mansonella ozzardi]MCA4775113.1 hypothetical protein [Wolbachia endosymbiont of Mansonella ozzardi]
MTSITNNPGTKYSEMEDFWSIIEEETKKMEKLEQKLLTLKKRELYRQHVSLAIMAPFALLMAIELEKTCSVQVLLGAISGSLSRTILPFTVLSLICTLYLIYNNKKIAQKEQELKDLENGEVAEKEKRNVPHTVDNYLNYADAALITLVIVASIVSEALEQGIIEDVALSISSLLYFVANANFFYREYKKGKEHEVDKEQENSNLDEKSKKKTNNMSAASLIFAGSSIMLIRRIMLITLASFLHPAVGPALGLVGITLLMAGSELITHLYKRELKDVEVGKGIKGAGKGTAGAVASNVDRRDGTNQEATVCIT